MTKWNGLDLEMRKDDDENDDDIDKHISRQSTHKE